MLADEVELLVQNAYAASQFFLLNANVDHSSKLDDALSKLNYALSAIDPTARLTLKSSNLSDFLLQCSQLLSKDSSNASIRSRLCLVFFNFALYNVAIRRFLASELQLCALVIECLQRSIAEKLGPQNLIDHLRLLQVLTYDKSLTLGTWTNELILFLISEILKAENDESIETSRKTLMDHPLPYCMTILCNLAERSKVICNKIKKMASFKHLCRRLLDLLQNNSRTVVVCSLVLIGYLDEKTRDTIFSPQNIAQTFLCIFNVLGSSDSLMTVHIAVDLLKRLVISTPSYGSYTLTSTAKNFTSYQFFEKSMQRVANMLVQFDSRSEELEKIFDLLLSFCKVNDLKKAVCSAIIKTPTSERRLTTPCISICRIAALTCDEAIRPNNPLNALQLLTHLIREAVDNGIKLETLVPSNKICGLVEFSIKSPIETKSSIVNFQCTRVTEGLRLAEAAANDEEIRQDVLDVVNAPLCAHINESQLLSNPIVSFMNKLRSSTSLRLFTEDLPEWCLNGVAIPLQLLRLLATLKDYSKMHKDLYWKSLKDDRLIPFIAFAISRGDDQMVYDSFVLFTHCAQVQNFPTRLLSDLVANCTNEYKVYQKEVQRNSNSTFLFSNDASCESITDYPLFDMSFVSQESFKQIDELLEKMKNGMDLKDIRTSQLVCAFEKKVAMLKSREHELEQMIAMKEQALSQSERLRTVCQDRGNGEEISNLRLVLCDLERRLSESNNQLSINSVEKNELTARVSEMQHCFDKERAQHNIEVGALQNEKNMLLAENDKERELQTVLRRRFDEMTSKFDIATKTIFEKQEEIELIALRASDANIKAAHLQKSLDDLKSELLSIKETAKSQSNQLIEQQKESEKLKEENKKLLKIKQTMAQMLND